MNTILLILFLLLAAAAVALSLKTRKPVTSDSLSLPPQNFDGLFAEQQAEELRLLAQAEAKLRAEEECGRLVARAAEGDETALDEAHERGDAENYGEVLQTLVARADGDPELLRSIAEYIVDSRKLRSTGEFAATMIEQWRGSLDQRSLVDLLQLAALSDDVTVFKRAVRIAQERFNEGRIPRITATDFLAAVESAYWLFATEVRYSGSGFTLKQLIAEVRRELAAAPRRSA
jgi:hypothetical protein